ncbi:TonB family protein [Bradyrhizobium sp. ORS 375]|uniref:TonB family protein n=1 Tax=Bradyrhizobium sp. (strain ORS 375) TaxID=566679 RepID=UPI001FCC6948|nr:TonB family protein [Bradyrhizobium sp. ORS 375]
MADSAKDSWNKSIGIRLTAQRRYPPHAGSQGGTTKVLFRIDRSGRLISVALVESTGDPALDKEALTIVERAQPFPPPPPDLDDDGIDLRVPFIFPPRPRRRSCKTWHQSHPQ